MGRKRNLGYFGAFMWSQSNRLYCIDFITFGRKSLAKSDRIYNKPFTKVPCKISRETWQCRCFLTERSLSPCLNASEYTLTSYEGLLGVSHVGMSTSATAEISDSGESGSEHVWVTGLPSHLSDVLSWCPAEGSGSEGEMKARFNQRLAAGPLTSDLRPPTTWPRPAAVAALTADSKGRWSVTGGHGGDLRGRQEPRQDTIWGGGVTAPCCTELVPSGASHTASPSHLPKLLFFCLSSL